MPLDVSGLDLDDHFKELGTSLRHEPPCHHVALPCQPMVALLVTSFCWGWVRVAGVIALSWGALTRIGEVLAA